MELNSPEAELECFGGGLFGATFDPIMQYRYEAYGCIFRYRPDGSGLTKVVDNAIIDHDLLADAGPGIAIDLGLPFPLLSDLARFQNCYTGSDSGDVASDCIGLDLSRDNDVDLADYARFAAPILTE